MRMSPTDIGHRSPVCTLVNSCHPMPSSVQDWLRAEAHIADTCMQIYGRGGHLSLSHSVNLLHLRRLICGALDLLERGQIVIVAQALIIVIDAQSQLDHAVDAARELSRLVKVEARGEQRRVEKEPN